MDKSKGLVLPNSNNRYCAYAGTGGEDGPIYLIEGKEELLEIIPVPITIERQISPIEALLMVGQSGSEETIGNSPLIASTMMEGNTNAALKLFMVEFGRDSLETAKTLIGEYPKIGLRTLLSLASTQGLGQNPKSEEEEGKIIHENRDKEDPIAQFQSREHGWEWPYYGSVDATLLFIQLAGSYARRYGLDFMNHTYTNRQGREEQLKNSFRLAINWAERRMEKSPLGFVEYYKENGGGTDNKVWRDSREAYHHQDGTFADNTYGIASFSVQVDAYKAFKAATHLFPEKALDYDETANCLRNAILKHFWVDDGQYFSLGSERDEEGKNNLLRIKTSDMGHILESGILYGDDKETIEKKEAVVRMLFSDEMLNISGIRTLSKHGIRFNAGAYHNGSVWPRENIKIARGLENHGYFGLARELHRRNVGIWEATGIFPELVRGDDAPAPNLNRRIVRVLTHTPKGDYVYNLEQPGQLIQTWTVAAVLQSMRQLERYKKRDLPSESEDSRKVEFEKKISSGISYTGTSVLSLDMGSKSG